MPIYEYSVVEKQTGCTFCRTGFERMEPLNTPPLPVCPECSCRIERIISAPRIGVSGNHLDDRAKQAGFQKLKKLGKGEYEQEF